METDFGVKDILMVGAGKFPWPVHHSCGSNSISTSLRRKARSDRLKICNDVQSVCGDDSAKYPEDFCVEELLLNASQDLEELRRIEVMEAALIEHSSGERTSGVHNFKTASTSGHKRPSRASLANDLSEVMAELEKDRELHQCKLKAMVPSDTGLQLDLKALSIEKDSNEAEQKSRGDNTAGRLCRGSSKGKEVSQANDEVEQLSERLKILEEENEYMKQAFLNTLKERRMLLDEIYQQFKEIHRCFPYRNILPGERSCDRSLVVIPCEDQTYGKGPSQVLSQESSSSVVTRHSKKKNISGPEMTLLDIP